VTSKNTVPTAATRRREPLCSTRASRIDSTHSEHGLMPSTKPITTVLTTSERPPRSTSPMKGTSTTSDGSGSTSWPSRAADTTTRISSPIASENPTHMVAHEGGGQRPPAAAAVAANSSRFAALFLVEADSSAGTR
jgi:hypothetical protein